MENIKEILEKETDILFAYLFGSHARGTQNKGSDIDIAIYLKDASILERDALYPSRLAIKIEKMLGENKQVDLRILNDSTLRFRSQVIRFGKILHSKDEGKRIDFETKALTHYYDFKPFLDIYDAARKVRFRI